MSRGGRICLQLVHAGGQADSKNAGRQPLAPSAVKVDQYPELPQELTQEQIGEIVAAFAIAAGLDGIALSRPLIWEPDLPRRWQQGDTSKAKCIFCNGCFRPGLREGGIRCVVADA